MEFKTEKFAHSQKSMTFNQYIGHKDDIYKYALELLNTVWPLSEPVRTLALKLNNLRYRTEKDSALSIVETQKENLKFFMGKGRKPGCDLIETETDQVNPGTEMQ